jgi:putative tryptophan/tyrosine transport system substrate-binding protein
VARQLGRLRARAQQAAVPVIGWLGSGTASPIGPITSAFSQGLGEQGYVEGRNVEILYRSAERTDGLPALAADLVRRGVALIVTTDPGTAAALAAKSATATIPIVFGIGSDPVGSGLVASLNRPGGNLTGVYFLNQALAAKHLELLHKIAPAATTAGFLVNPTNPAVEAQNREAEIAARILGVHLMILNATTPNETEAAFATIVGQRIGALAVDADSLFFSQRDQLPAFAARHAVPTVYAARQYVDAGGLMSYGARLSDTLRLVGTYAGRILKGAKPADLPVMQSTKFEFVINLKTAKALGLTVPQSLLAIADEVIE